MLIRRVNNSGASATVLTFSSTNQNVVCAGSISSNSDRALKDGETPITAKIGMSCYRGQTPLNPESLQNLLKKYLLKGFAKHTDTMKNLSERVSPKVSFLLKVSCF